ncbi:origin of replication complex subunit 2 [Selaginella moellendorffii]|uniref:origin of replication complex subunit 2 n=1 Tax=Selaginella moellendorffii TaxID=88036 RepID=UPI000D1D0C11|nr:origin of replication complex subunit 2 [Selaginella moellendorffii]|eukprot:XP_024533686.1 origin of replication complex subunit 2 [Selaginella moellendorffii]
MPKRRRRSNVFSIAQAGEVDRLQEVKEQHCDEVERVLETAGAAPVDAGENGTPSRKESSSSKRSAKAISDVRVVDEQELRAALAQLVPKHQVEQARLLDSYKESYPHWFFQLKCGFGLLMYGFGSKRQLLEDFGSTALTDGAAVVSLSRLRSKSLPGFAYFEANIDGPGLRDGATQQQLAKLASCSHFRIVSSIDSINGPLLWDKRMANTQFNWWWHHTPTYAAYDAEASHVPLLLSSLGTSKSVRSALLVLQSLTTNAQSVFKETRNVAVPALQQMQGAFPGEQRADTPSSPHGVPRPPARSLEERLKRTGVLADHSIKRCSSEDAGKSVSELAQPAKTIDPASSFPGIRCRELSSIPGELIALALGSSGICFS